MIGVQLKVAMLTRRLADYGRPASLRLYSGRPVLNHASLDVRQFTLNCYFSISSVARKIIRNTQVIDLNLPTLFYVLSLSKY